MNARIEEGTQLVNRALRLSRTAPLVEVRSLFQEAVRLFQDHGRPGEAAGALIEEARVLGGCAL